MLFCVEVLWVLGHGNENINLKEASSFFHEQGVVRPKGTFSSLSDGLVLHLPPDGT